MKTRFKVTVSTSGGTRLTQLENLEKGWKLAKRGEPVRRCFEWEEDGSAISIQTATTENLPQSVSFPTARVIIKVEEYTVKEVEGD